MSVDNIPERCREEIKYNINVVKVKESVVPVFQIASQEFVDSQEFNEDNYLGDIDNSFLSNRTVIEKDQGTVDDGNDTLRNKDIETNNEELKNEQNDKGGGADVYRAIPINIDNNSEDLNVTIESVEGEYHSFIDDMDFEEVVYESPVKNLVEKDIRDYSIPIDFYCDDYSKKDSSPKKSPMKQLALAKQNILEPILEESKSSYDDSSDSSKLQNKEDSVKEHHILNEDKSDKNSTENVDNSVKIVSIDSNNFKDHSNDRIEEHENRLSSLSGTTSEKGSSFDSTAEFEKVELIADLVSSILNNVENKINEDTLLFEKRHCTENMFFYLDTSTEEVQEIEKEEEFESFSITQMVENLRRNMNETILTETSESGFSITHTIVEAIVYYIFDAAFYYCANKEKCNKRKQYKKVITVVDYEDILFTTLPGWLGFDVTDKISDDNAEEAARLYSNDKLDIQISNDDNDRWLGFNESLIDVTTGIDNNNVEGLADLNANYTFTEIDDKNEEFEKNKEYDDENNGLYVEIHKTDGINAESTNFNTSGENFDLLTVHNVEQEANMAITLAKFNTSDEELGVMKVNEEENNRTDMSSERNESFYSNDITENEQDIARIEDTSSFSYHDMCDELEDNNETDTSQQFDGNSAEIAAYIICSLIEKSCRIQDEDSQLKTSFNDTFVLNTAFVESDMCYGRSSSPERSQFEECTVSPIRHANKSFAGDDLTVLYEKDDTILGSPFVKKANILSMSQTVHSGGIKYWLSFDDNLDLEIDRPKRKPKFSENLLPSFVVVDLEDKMEKTNFVKEFDEKFLDETNVKRRSGVLCSDDVNVNRNDRFFNNDNIETQTNDIFFDNGNIERHTSDTFGTEASEYNTCESPVDSKTSNLSFQERLIFDCKLESNNKERLIFDSRLVATKRRLHSSWPPFEHTIFYKIISKFRLSESFDLSDLDKARFDNTL
ncbi:dentin sialophosphoprotein-like [Maniola hyperantus]|uniref:dentin sialophosphoprotein-like n=1 Tax=Aphantopus hyperantus TaxID=2795564 RepID=UPI003748A666